MLIEFDWDHVFFPGSDLVMDLQTAREMVELQVRANLIYLTRAARLGYRIPRLRQSGVRYQTVDRWMVLPKVYRLGVSDCKNLTPIDIAESRFYDRVDAQPSFRWVENADHTYDYHILKQIGADFSDVNLELGMNAEEVAKFYAVGAQTG